MRAVDLAANDTRLACGTAKGEAFIFDVKDGGRQLLRVGCSGIVYSVDLSGDGLVLVTGDQMKQAISAISCRAMSNE